MLRALRIITASLWLVAVGAGGSALAQDIAPSQVLAKQSDQALLALQSLSAKRSKLIASKTTIRKKYETKLREIDQLKSERRSWRRDRALNDLKADSQRIADELAIVDRSLLSIRKSYRDAHAQLQTNVKRELLTDVSTSRKIFLEKIQRKYQASSRTGAKKIVLPEQRIDASADPEELLEQLNLIKQTEQKLLGQERRLLARADKLGRQDTLRRKNRRAYQFRALDDDRVSRSSTSRSSSRSAGAGNAGNDGDAFAENDGPDNSPQAPNDAAEGGGDPIPLPEPDAPRIDTPTNSIEAGLGSLDEATVILSEVVDGQTKNALFAASKSNDPGVKARAARLAEKSVRKKRQELERLRLQIEKRLRTMSK